MNRLAGYPGQVTRPRLAPLVCPPEFSSVINEKTRATWLGAQAKVRVRPPCEAIILVEHSHFGVHLGIPIEMHLYFAMKHLQSALSDEAGYGSSLNEQPSFFNSPGLYSDKEDSIKKILQMKQLDSAIQAFNQPSQDKRCEMV